MKFKNPKYYLNHENCILNFSNNFLFKKEIIDFKNHEEENDLIFELIKNLPLNSVFVDVGCHQGDTTIYIAKKLKSIKRKDIKIICIDPHPNNIKFIENEIKKLQIKNVIPMCVVVSDKQEYYMPNNDVEFSRSCTGLIYKKSKEKTNFISNSLDNLLEKFIGNIRFLKIDVEGHEQYVLNGAKKILLNDHPNIYVEIWNNNHAILRLGKEGKNHTEKIISHLKNYNIIQKYEKNYYFNHEKNNF